MPLLLDCQCWKKCGKIQNVVSSSDFEIFSPEILALKPTNLDGWKNARLKPPLKPQPPEIFLRLNLCGWKRLLTFVCLRVPGFRSPEHSASFLLPKSHFFPHWRPWYTHTRHCCSTTLCTLECKGRQSSHFCKVSKGRRFCTLLLTTQQSTVHNNVA